MASVPGLLATAAPCSQLPSRNYHTACMMSFSCVSAALDAILNQGLFPPECPGCKAVKKVSFIPQQVLDMLAQENIITGATSDRFERQTLLSLQKFKECPLCQQLSLSAEPGYKRVQCRHCLGHFCQICDAAWHEGVTCEVFQREKKQRNGVDEETKLFIQASSKPCPQCGIPISHYFKHACHHIRPGTGCPNCHVHFCYVCLTPYENQGNHRCENGCPLFCPNDRSCNCPTCPDCQPGRPCQLCDAEGCPQCQVTEEKS